MTDRRLYAILGLIVIVASVAGFVAGIALSITGGWFIAAGVVSCLACLLALAVGLGLAGVL